MQDFQVIWSQSLKLLKLQMEHIFVVLLALLYLYICYTVAIFILFIYILFIFAQMTFLNWV